MKARFSPLDAAREAWGEDLPDWVETLAIQCGLTSQIAVAREIGRSGAVISQVLRRKYPADTHQIEERVRGVYLEGRVACPGLGDIPTHECQDWRNKSRTFVIGNPTRARMYRACLVCPRNRKQPDEEAAE
ncbi:MAG: hypothetical protein ACK4GW_13565 [Pseudorhodobacter sp.]